MPVQATLNTGGYTTFLDAMLLELLVYVHLYTNDPSVTPVLVKADLVESSFPGYSPRPLGKWTLATMRGGIAFSVAEAAVFNFSGSTPPPAVRGYFATAGIDGPLLFVVKMPDPPFEFTADARNLSVNVEARWPILCPA